MSEKKGTISVQTGDIFPIIKKWLYSEHDIFLRELTSNATDAITKRATLARTENVELPVGEITSGTISPVLGIGIAMGYVQTAFSKVETGINVVVRNRKLKAEVVKFPFV